LALTDRSVGEESDTVMSERLDEIAKKAATPTPRRSVLTGLGALALGSLGILGISQGTEAAENPCQKCKRQCKRNNRKSGKKDPKNCSNKCRNKC
jgi:hypothetical protein